MYIHVHVSVFKCICHKIILKEYTFPTFLYIFDPIRTWKWGLDTHFANCLKSGTMILLNSAGSITSRISSSSFRNITCNTHLSKYNVKLLTEFSKISGFSLISTFDSIYSISYFFIIQSYSQSLMDRRETNSFPSILTWC